MRSPGQMMCLLVITSICCGCSEDGAVSRDTNTDEQRDLHTDETTDTSEPCLSEGPGITCAANEVCLFRSGCYPREGMANSTCGALPVIPVKVEVDPNILEGQLYRTALLAGTVTEITDRKLALDASGRSVSIEYDIGPHIIPVTIGEEIVVEILQYAPFNRATGLAVRSPAGELVALVDDGNYGSAWLSSAEPQAALHGITLTGESVGCPVRETQCVTSVPVGLRFSHGTNGVLVPPGGEGALLVGEAEYRAFNADVEEVAAFHCTDTAARAAWFVLKVVE